MKTFGHFPKELVCPLCGTDDDKPCALAIVDGTSIDGICEAIPIHIDCIKLRYDKELNLLYHIMP
jgi:hypothetical protein